MQTTLDTSTTSPRNNRDLRSLLSLLRLGPLAAKCVVIFLCTLCWLCVALVRSNAPRDPQMLEGTSMVALASSLQHGAVSGRDFQSLFGPGTQFLAWVAASFTETDAPHEVYGMIVFVLCMFSAILIALTLFACDRVSWQDAAIIYSLCFFLNLFFGVLDFRTALLLLTAVCAYRITAAETIHTQLIWATVTGVLCFVSQLVAIELVIYSLISVVCALIAGSILTRNAWVLLGIEVLVATLAAANIGLVILFQLTSADYGLAFDYQNYSLEILRGYHNTMGTLWQLPWTPTLILLLVTAYIIGKCIMVAMESDPLEASLFAGVGFAAVIWIRTAFVSSDVTHITSAFTPMIIVLGLFATREWASKQTRVVWVVAVVGVLFAWPAFNGRVAAEVVQVVRGDVPKRATVRRDSAAAMQLDGSVLRMIAEQTDRNVPVLGFPHNNNIEAGVRRPPFTPVLESYAASTESLQRYYIQALDRQRSAGLDVIYGLDGGIVPHVGDVQAITRTPAIFEYLYKQFELVSEGDHVDGHYLLRERYRPREVTMEPLGFSMPHQLADSGTVKLDAPSACGLIRLQLQIEYTKKPGIFRPSGMELRFSEGNQVVWRGSVRPLEPNQTFATYVSPLPPEAFHKIFSPGPVQSPTWDKFEYRNLPADLLGSRAKRIRVLALQCVDPQQFAAAPTTAQMGVMQ